MIWYKIDESNMCIVCFPVNHSTRPERYAHGRKREKKIWLLSVKAIGDGSKCRISYVSSIENEIQGSEALVTSAIHCHKYFLSLKDLKEMDEMIGHGIGEVFMTKSDAERRAGCTTLDSMARVDEVISKHKVRGRLSGTLRCSADISVLNVFSTPR